MLLTPLRANTALEVFPALMIGFIGNNLLPAHLGKFVRTYILARQLGLRNIPVLATIVLERMFDFLTALFFLVLIFLVGTKVPANLANTG